MIPSSFSLFGNGDNGGGLEFPETVSSRNKYRVSAHPLHLGTFSVYVCNRKKGEGGAETLQTRQPN